MLLLSQYGINTMRSLCLFISIAMVRSSTDVGYAQRLRNADCAACMQAACGHMSLRLGRQWHELPSTSQGTSSYIACLGLRSSTLTATPLQALPKVNSTRRERRSKSARQDTRPQWHDRLQPLQLHKEIPEEVTSVQLCGSSGSGQCQQRTGYF
jgi:hypothetical protein